MPNSVFQPGRITILDGGLGTMLQKAGMAPGQRPEVFGAENPDVLTNIHRAYVQAGAEILCCNTFGANQHKLAGTGLSVEEAVNNALGCAKKAAAEKSGVRVALDVGPLGELLEPGGLLSFEAAYESFARLVRAGAAAGADLILIETISDLYEAKAALLAARENSGLPVLVSMTFEENGRSFSGTPVEALAAALGSMGPDALGINCSIGPAQVLPLAGRLCAATPLPVFLKPNAGLPDPATGAYSLSAADFCGALLPAPDMGVAALGGCCGTSPQTIAALAQAMEGRAPLQRAYRPASWVCSGSQAVQIDAPLAIGERINPTGKKRLQAALQAGDLSYVQAQAAAQEADGAAILDVNVGAAGVNEVKLLPAAVKAVQAVSSLPLQLDSANPAALEAALRVYNGKPIVNSTSGEADKLAAILPLCKKYGAAVVGLALDEQGIPETAEGRVAVARRIVQAAVQAGIPQEDVYIDCLTLTAGAAPEAPAVTLAATRRVKQELDVKTLLGVSNVSFGLPERALVNQVFLAQALAAGLDLPILNPGNTAMMDTLYAHRLLAGNDKGAANFTARFAQTAAAAPRPAAEPGDAYPLDKAIEQGLKTQALAAARHLLEAGRDGLSVVEEYLMPALDRVGAAFEEGTLFLPQLLAAAGAAQAAFEPIRASFGEGTDDGPPVVLATVQGDVHDIGKNIVKVLLENYGFNVIDLGRDVPAEQIVEAALESNTRLVGLSALMTTTLPAMAEAIAGLQAAGYTGQTVVGGAVLTESYALHIGASHYAKDAKRTVDIARETYGKA